MMEIELDKDLEVIDLGAAWTLYAASLVNAAISLNRGAHPSQDEVTKYASRLRDQLSRCRVTLRVPTSFGSGGEVLRLLGDSGLVSQIGSLLAGVSSRRSELLFLLTCSLGAAMSAQGLQEPRESLNASIERLGSELRLPRRFRRRLIANPDLGVSELRAHVRSSARRHPRWEIIIRTIEGGLLAATFVFAVMWWRTQDPSWEPPVTATGGVATLLTHLFGRRLTTA